MHKIHKLIIKPFFILTILFLIISRAPSVVLPAEGNEKSHTTHSVIDDYDPLTGQPKCINCHNGEAKPSIDYTRDASCLQCHNSGFSDKYLAIDSKFDKTIIASAKTDNTTGDTPKLKKKEISSPDNMMLIPAGEFTMGSNEWWPKCQPAHKVSVNTFYMDKYEVTNKQYKKFVTATKREPPADWDNGKIPKGRENHPVVFVSWFDGNDFCKWDGKRLPTEAEWEKAARGTDGRTFPWGNKFDAKKGNMPQLGKGDTMPVGSFENGKSPYGLYDMAGNVFEWTFDWFKPYPGNTHPDENYGERYKVVRGGSWYDCTYYKCGISSPTYNRIFFNPNTTNNNFGFRCAKDADK